MSKESLRAPLLAALSRECDNLTRAALDSRSEAIDEESRPENKYDMHSQEAAYLAEGQARLAAELQASLTAFQTLPLPSFAGQPIDVGALIELEQQGRKTWYLLGPRSGGLEFEWEGRNVIVITPVSPLGALLRGLRAGDVVKVSPKPGTKPATVVSVV